MHYTIYVDLVWLVQCYINGILLIWIKFFLRKESTFFKIMFASIFGGTGNTFMILGYRQEIYKKFTHIFPILTIIYFVLLSFGMFWCAFGRQSRKGYIKLISMYWVTAIVFAGFLSFAPRLTYSVCTYHGLIQVSGKELFIKGIVFLVLLPVVNQFYQKIRWKHTQCYMLEFEHRGKRIKGMGLLDTGNCLKNYQNNEPVIVAEYQFMKSLFSREEQEYLERLMDWNCHEKNEDIKVVYIPYHSLGQSHGILLGVYIEQLRIYLGNERKERMHNLVGLYRGKISAGEDYQVILHIDCVEAKDNMR